MATEDLDNIEDLNKDLGKVGRHISIDIAGLVLPSVKIRFWTNAD